jgi:MFS family permease
MKVLRLKATTVVLVMLCLMYFITYLDRVNVSTAAAGFGKEFNLSKTQIGLVFSAFAYPYLVFQIIGGWVSDRYGARRTLIWCGTIWAVATIITGFAGGLVSLLLARLLLGLGEGATFPAATSAMGRWVSKENRGFAQGITHAFSRIGNAVAPAAVVATMAAYGWREAFYVCGARAWPGSSSGRWYSPNTRRSTRASRRKNCSRCPPRKRSRCTCRGARCSGACCP